MSIGILHIPAAEMDISETSQSSLSVSQIEEAVPEIQPFFQDLYEQNSDIIGWLQAGGGIDYPVMQLDNDFYLHHDFNKNEKYAGTLFVNQINYLWPRDKILFIHGHNMRDGSMFGGLMAYEDYEYVRQHPLIMFRTLYDPEEVYYTPVYGFNASMNEGNPDYFNLNWIYMGNADSPFDPEPEEAEEKDTETEMYSDLEEIISPDQGLEKEDTQETGLQESKSQETAPQEPDQQEFDPQEFDPQEPDPQEPESETEHILSAEDIAVAPKRCQTYLDAMKKLSIWQSPIEAAIDDEYIALITCSYYQENGRFILVCRKLRKDETPEAIRSAFGI